MIGSFIEKILLPFQRQTSSGRYLPELDGLRCVAVILVVAFHTHGFFTSGEEPSSLPVLITLPTGEALSFMPHLLISRGWFGVQIFFLISGLVLSLPYAAHYLCREEKPLVRKYFRRRLIRIELPNWLAVLSDKNIAMACGAGLALLLASRRSAVKTVIQEALSSGGVIILITAAGAAFGSVLQDTGIGNELSVTFGAGGGILLLAFGLTALVRFAQGSATVAMITSVGIVAPMALSADLGFHPVYLALAIGCGSKPLPWMNDSGFWIIAKMSGMNERETLKTFSVMLSLMGVAGFLVVFLASLVLPMV